MLKKSAVENILAAALESGADFAEIYAERTKRSSIAMVNGKVETALGGMDYGAGVRLFFGNQAIYGFTNDLSEESLIRIAREGAAALRGDRIYDICGWKRMAERCINPIRILPESVSKQRKAEQLRLASAAARAYHDAVTQTRAGFPAGKGWRSAASIPSVSCRKACPSRERRSSFGWHPRRQGHITMPLRRQGQAILRS